MRLSNICKSYGDIIAFDNFSADFPDGELSRITGKSGSGKTTLLRIIAGLEDFSGEIHGRPEKISVVFQEDRLFNMLSAMENCALVSKKSGGEIREMLLATGLSEEDIFRPANELSGGMKRRTAIVRALCHGGDLFLMDEPFKGIDNENRLKTEELIKKICGGKTVIIVTHDAERDFEANSSNIIKL